jgi:hypothetical protein
MIIFPGTGRGTSEAGGGGSPHAHRQLLAAVTSLQTAPSSAAETI